MSSPGAFPVSVAHSFVEGILEPGELLRLLSRLPVGESAVALLGSEEGFDSTRWSVEFDAGLAELAARKLAEPLLNETLSVVRTCGRDLMTWRALLAICQHQVAAAQASGRGVVVASLAADLVQARFVSVQGISAEDMHRRLRPGATATARLLVAAIQRGVLTGDEILSEGLSWIRRGSSSARANEFHGASRAPSQSSRGVPSYRAWPDLAAILTVEDPAPRNDIFELIEQAVRRPEASPSVVLARVFDQCESLLGAHGELLLLWLHGHEGYVLVHGSSAHLLLVRAGEVREIGPGDERSRSVSPTLRVLDVREGDTFLLLGDLTMVDAVFHQASPSGAAPSAPPTVLGPGDAISDLASRSDTLQSRLRRRFVERLTSIGAERVDLTVRSLSTAPVTAVTDALLHRCPGTQEKAAVVIRVVPWIPPADLEARLSTALLAYAAREGISLELRSAEITFSGDGQRPPGRARHLSIVIACDARFGETRAAAIADRFVGALLRRHPHLCSSHHIQVEPLQVREEDSLSTRIAAVRAIAEEIVANRIGLEVRISAVPSWGKTRRLEVVILRDDVDDAADEDAAAKAVSAALARADRALARMVSVRGEYIK